LAIGIYSFYSKSEYDRTFLLRGFIFFIAGIFPWILRGIILSGCIIYPVSILRLSFLKWVVSEKILETDMVGITGWARLPGPDYIRAYSENIWFKTWLENFISSQLFLIKLFLISAVLFVIVLILRFFNFSKRDKYSKYKTLYFPILLLPCIVFWFLQAPDVRFAFGIFFSFIIFLLAFSLNGLIDYLGGINRISIFNRFSFTAAFVLLFFSINFTKYDFEIKKYIVHSVETSKLNINDLKIQGEAETVQKKTKNGDIVNVPSFGDRTFNMELPATPYFNKKLIIEKDRNGNPEMFYF
jgi:hypothetical protein